jgi:hypothetical protein
MLPLTVGGIWVRMFGDNPCATIARDVILGCAVVFTVTSRAGSRLHIKFRRTHVPHDGNTFSTHLFRLS